MVSIVGPLKANDGTREVPTTNLCIGSGWRLPGRAQVHALSALLWSPVPTQWTVGETRHPRMIRGHNGKSLTRRAGHRTSGAGERTGRTQGLGLAP
jgi:hypothetical protein